jgi:hypothetical protein
VGSLGRSVARKWEYVEAQWLEPVTLEESTVSSAKGKCKQLTSRTAPISDQLHRYADDPLTLKFPIMLRTRKRTSSPLACTINLRTTSPLTLPLLCPLILLRPSNLLYTSPADSGLGLISVRRLFFASYATSPGSPHFSHSFFRSLGWHPETSWMAFERMFEPIPSSQGTYEGRRWFERR